MGERHDEMEDMEDNKEDNKEDKGEDGGEGNRAKNMTKSESESQMPLEGQIIVLIVCLLHFSYIEECTTQHFNVHNRTAIWAPWAPLGNLVPQTFSYWTSRRRHQTIITSDQYGVQSGQGYQIPGISQPFYILFRGCL